MRIHPYFQADLLPAEDEAGVLGEGGDGLEQMRRRKRCLEWCLDHGFEYVEADCRDAHGGEFGMILRE